MKKGMLNEILPDPKQAERDLKRGSPRDRTAQHLQRIVAAAAALHLGATSADSSVPGDKGKDSKGADAQKPPDQPAGATVLVDGEDAGEKTPVKKLRVNPGMHAITVTAKQSFDLRPPKTKK